MIKKIFVILSLSTLFSTLSFATDLLAFYTNGKLTENSPGVKVLSLDEKKQVRGGYVVQDGYISANEKAAFAIVTVNAKDAGVSFEGRDGVEIKYDRYGNYVDKQSGLCPLGSSTCKAPSYNKLQEFMQVAGDPVLNALGYTVKRNIGISSLGNKFVYFTYGVIVYNFPSKTFYRVNSSAVLNNNLVIKELAQHYKETFESDLGGYYIRNIKR